LVIDKSFLNSIVPKDTIAPRTYPQLTAFVKKKAGYFTGFTDGDVNF
jgi:hypothetical protein